MVLFRGPISREHVTAHIMIDEPKAAVATMKTALCRSRPFTTFVECHRDRKSKKLMVLFMRPILREHVTYSAHDD